MSTAGPLSPGTVVTQATLGTVGWSNPTNAEVFDGVYATATLAATIVSEYLSCSNYGFSIPGGATINGITANVYVLGSGTAIFQDNSVRLLKASGVTGSDYASAVTWASIPSNRVYGGVSDLWGTTWTPTDINGTGFGVNVSAINNGAAPGTAQIDYVSITVTFTSANQVAQQIIVVQSPRASYDLTLKPD